MTAKRWCKLILAVLLIFGSLPVWAQQRDIKLELGFAGEIVADNWNPLRLTMRDQPDAELVLEIDHGNLREGSKIFRYLAPLSGQRGISVFEDDVFIPVWRSFSWLVQSGEVILASGSFDRRQLDPRPLELILSNDIGTARTFFDKEARVIEAKADDLPERVASYQGVNTLLLDGSAANPRLAAVVAATVAGVKTLILEPLTPERTALLRLAPEPRQRLGAGWIARAPAANAAEVLTDLPSLELKPLTEALLSPEMTREPTGIPQFIVLLLAGLYLVLILLMIRFGRGPGILAALSLSLVLSLAAWGYFRPQQETLLRARSLHLGSGDLALTSELQTLFRLPEGLERLNLQARPLDVDNYRQSPTELSFAMPRWSQATLILRPVLSNAQLQWQGEMLVNNSSQNLSDVFVLGLGPQGTLPPGASLLLRFSDDGLVPALYQPLSAALPVGTALARRGGQIHVALAPEFTSLAWSQP